MNTRLRKGFGCWFKHPDDGRIIEGTYQGRRRVIQTTSFERTATGFEEGITTWTVPPSIRIHAGRPSRTPAIIRPALRSV